MADFFINKSFVVTRGSSGIGKFIVCFFAIGDALDNIVDYNIFNAGKIVEDLKSKGKCGSAYQCDVSNQSNVEDTKNQIDKIDILINNTGIAHIGQAVDTNPHYIDQVINVNIKVVYHFLNAVIPKMRNGGGGVILNRASDATRVGIQGRFAFSLSKGAAASMTLSVPSDFLSDNIRCNSIFRGRVQYVSAYRSNFG